TSPGRPPARDDAHLRDPCTSRPLRSHRTSRQVWHRVMTDPPGRTHRDMDETASGDTAAAENDTAGVVDALVTAQQEKLIRPGADPEELTARMRQVHQELTTLRMHYQFGIDEVRTKVDILRREFELIHDYSPIEHVRARLKSTESLIVKAVRTGASAPAFHGHAAILRPQRHPAVLTVTDSLAAPNPTPYPPLHLIVRGPVSLPPHPELVRVELQLRTIAMDFWASTEHKLSYKYRRNLPAPLRGELDDAARVAAELDARMERLRDEIRPLPPNSPTSPGPAS